VIGVVRLIASDLKRAEFVTLVGGRLHYKL
jgi:hypothetical protein